MEDLKTRPVCPLEQQGIVVERFVSGFLENLRDKTAPGSADLAHALTAALCEVWRTGAEFQLKRGAIKLAIDCPQDETKTKGSI